MFAEAIAVAHEHGAKVTAHCFGTAVLPGLIEAGIDCIEHGTGLTPDLVESMVAHGTALVPTVMQVDKFPEYAEAGADKFPDYAATMTDLYARRRETIMSAHEAGVPLYAGSDGGGVRKHGNIAGEVRAMAELGMGNEAALGAASWRAREWLGWNATLDEGAPADFVVYDADPLADLSVLARPTCVMLRGRVVAEVAVGSRLLTCTGACGLGYEVAAAERGIPRIRVRRGLADLPAESRDRPDPLTRSDASPGAPTRRPTRTSALHHPEQHRNSEETPQPCPSRSV